MTPNVQVVFRWITDVAWFGKVEVFDNPYGTGAPIVTKRGVDPSGEAVAATHQNIMVPMGHALRADTSYFFRVSATDPTGNNPDLVTPTPLQSFFTGAHAAKESTASLVSLPVYTAREATTRRRNSNDNRQGRWRSPVRQRQHLFKHGGHIPEPSVHRFYCGSECLEVS